MWNRRNAINIGRTRSLRATYPPIYSTAAACPWSLVCRSLVGACVSSGENEGTLKRHPLLATQAFSVLEGVLTVQSENQAGAVRLHMVRGVLQ